MTLHTYTPQPMSLPSMNFLHLTVSEIQPGQTISRRPPAHPDTMGENCDVAMSSKDANKYECLLALQLNEQKQLNLLSGYPYKALMQYG